MARGRPSLSSLRSPTVGARLHSTACTDASSPLHSDRLASGRWFSPFAGYGSCVCSYRPYVGMSSWTRWPDDHS
eukprot:5929903-Prymnesium_polylepis.1